MEFEEGKKLQVLAIKKSEPVIVRPASSSDESDYYLSGLDQVYQMISFSIVFYYAPPPDLASSDLTAVLRESLGRVLVHYQPLAGRIARDHDGRFVVKLNGEGVIFVEAEADCSIANVCKLEPDAQTLNNLFYPDSHFILTADEYFNSPLLQVQVTKFSCGGFVLGVVFNHLITDATAGAEFVKSWSEMARGVPLSIPPFHDRTILKSKIQPNTNFSPTKLQIQGPGVVISPTPSSNDRTDLATDVDDLSATVQKSFWFDADMLSRLKSEASTGASNACTTFEALAAFVWRSWVTMKAFDGEKIMKLAIAVNGRRRFNPALPTGFSGNVVVSVMVKCRARELLDNPLAFAAGLVREAVGRVTDKHLRAVVDGLHDEVSPLEGQTLVISSWARVDLWETDFGWGKPMHAAPGSIVPPFMAFFLRPAGGMGQYVMLGLQQAEAIKFEELTQAC